MIQPCLHEPDLLLKQQRNLHHFIRILAQLPVPLRSRNDLNFTFYHGNSRSMRLLRRNEGMMGNGLTGIQQVKQYHIPVFMQSCYFEQPALDLI
ncbi:hypothetical protein D3C80_1746400 [compost metagenome]